MRVAKRGETSPDDVRVGTGVRVRGTFPGGAYTRVCAQRVWSDAVWRMFEGRSRPEHDTTRTSEIRSEIGLFVEELGADFFC